MKGSLETQFTASLGLTGEMQRGCKMRLPTPLGAFLFSLTKYIEPEGGKQLKILTKPYSKNYF